MDYQTFLKILLADIAKAPLILADVNTVIADVKKLATDAGIPLPAAQAVAHSAEVVALEKQVIAHKFGDGTFLKTIGTFLQSPLGQSLLQLLLGPLIPKPAA
jgi:hypothetical protein